MIGSIIRKMQQSLDSGFRDAPEVVDIELAAAALLLEACRADHKVDPRELEVVHDLLGRVFDLKAPELDKLMERAQDHTQTAVCLHEFTRVLKARVHPQEREKLLQGLWHVALADGVIDKYEEHYIRRIADLVGLSHRAFVQARHRAEQAR